MNALPVTIEEICNGEWIIGGGAHDRQSIANSRQEQEMDRTLGENMSTLLTTPTTSKIDQLKAKMKATWMSGDYDLFSRYMEQDARLFYERLDVAAGCQ